MDVLISLTRCIDRLLVDYCAAVVDDGVGDCKPGPVQYRAGIEGDRASAEACRIAGPQCAAADRGAAGVGVGAGKNQYARSQFDNTDSARARACAVDDVAGNREVACAIGRVKPDGRTAAQTVVTDRSKQVREQCANISCRELVRAADIDSKHASCVNCNFILGPIRCGVVIQRTYCSKTHRSSADGCGARVGVCSRHYYSSDTVFCNTSSTDGYWSLNTYIAGASQCQREGSR